MEELLKLDQELFLYLNNLGSETWDWFWVFITHKFAAIPLYAVLLYLLYKNYGWKPTLVTVVLVAGMITCTDQLANVFKDYFQRPRPCKEPFIEQGRLLLDYCGSYGYFSAHAASSTALAIYLGNILKRWYKYALVGMIFWAVIVSYSRIYVGKHYPGDVITGMIIGGIIGFVFYKLQQFILRKYVA
ncbi:phosphatase PAP2 family protein [Mesonia maritima]|uniref:Undecaprenyl-diphosphatase n=1 Tax=Mesonia maritima TaxID=1793873 RepID=A0ABU1K4I7_9FLAO|nr:phosphatase PAP2 family protein [Mesonia maritima]MDR6300511.1 undecaprenyl-diphosphatase [Mesonia maritima]